ncbi:MAG: hypothetical protein IAE77_13805 [Prosthecobacter sp.]|jgi:hypothetical protein|uniref:hypothetical protein n=1 Tax=Prosthecobacter sp. TaxID=1965333 RepID=UPI0019F218C1|nr:hypothetical protein [Prosthecobacter sp.]MBE2284526.1 hypothetical protein [Prosthecobacter sp.]
MISGPPTSITDVYPCYSQRLLRVLLADYEKLISEYLNRTNRGHYRLSEMFEFEPLEFVILPEDVIISGSLFFKGCNYAKRDAHPIQDASGQIPLDELYKIPHPAFAGSKREPFSFFDNYVKPIIKGRWEPYKCVIFLAADLRCLKPILENRGIKVVMMRHSSLAHSPGAMWRYLAFNFQCRAVYFADTDREFEIRRVNHLLKLLEQEPKTALARPLQSTGSGGQMALILGNNFMAKPASVDFDAAESMLGYIVLNILAEDRPTNFVYENRHDRKPAIPRVLEQEYEGPMPSERVPLKCFPYYCFDEQWLKEVVYYHFSNGRIATQVQRHDPNDLIQSLDLSYQQENGNHLVWPAELKQV